MASKQGLALGKFIGTGVKAAMNAAKNNVASSASRPSGSAASSATSGSGVQWDKNTDYQSLINQAVSQGNYGAAAQYEQQRNAKIDATGSGHQKTNNYSQYLNGGNRSPFDVLTGVVGATALGTAANAAQDRMQTIRGYGNVDLGNSAFQSIMMGADADTIQNYLDMRNQKSRYTPGLEKYYNDQKQLAMQAYVNRMRQNDEYSEKMNQYYENAMEQQQAAYDAAAAAAAQQYRNLIPGINQSYDDAARQAYISNRMAQRDLPEQLAAAGLAGQGAAESSIVAQNNAYTTAYNQNELARQQALLNVDNQIANAYANASAQGAQSAADILREQANTQQSILAQQEQMRQNAVQNVQNYINMMGGANGMPTLSAQDLAASTAYNNKILQMQQAQADQSAANTQYAQYMEMADSYYAKYMQTFNPEYLALSEQYMEKARGLIG